MPPSRLHLVQSTLSVSIRSLERELGGRLFDRTTHQVELTDTGRALLAEARNVLSAADAARDAVAAVQGGLRGTVRVGIMHSLHLIDLAGSDHATTGNGPRCFGPDHGTGARPSWPPAADGDLDLAFAALPDEYPIGYGHRLASEPMQLVCPPTSAGCTAEHRARRTRRRPVRRIPVGWGTRNSVDRLFLAAGLHREVAVEVTTSPPRSNWSGPAFGYAFLAPSTIANTHRVALRRVRPSPQFSVSLITATKWAPSAATKAFTDLVIETYPSARVS